MECIGCEDKDVLIIWDTESRRTCLLYSRTWRGKSLLSLRRLSRIQCKTSREKLFSILPLEAQLAPTRPEMGILNDSRIA